MSPAPGAACISPPGLVLSGQAVAVAAVSDGAFVAQVREMDAPSQGPALVLFSLGGIGTTITLPGATRADTGHYLFHHDASTPATATSPGTVTRSPAPPATPKATRTGTSGPSTPSATAAPRPSPAACSRRPRCTGTAA